MSVYTKFSTRPFHTQAFCQTIGPPRMSANYCPMRLKNRLIINTDKLSATLARLVWPGSVNCAGDRKIPAAGKKMPRKSRQNPVPHVRQFTRDSFLLRSRTGWLLLHYSSTITASTSTKAALGKLAMPMAARAGNGMEKYCVITSLNVAKFAKSVR